MRAMGRIERFVYFYEVAKSLGFYFRQKYKLRQKAFATSMAESELILCSRTTNSSGVVRNSRKQK